MPTAHYSEGRVRSRGLAIAAVPVLVPITFICPSSAIALNEAAACVDWSAWLPVLLGALLTVADSLAGVGSRTLLGLPFMLAATTPISRVRTGAPAPLAHFTAGILTGTAPLNRSTSR